MVKTESDRNVTAPVIGRGAAACYLRADIRTLLGRVSDDNSRSIIGMILFLLSEFSIHRAGVWKRLCGTTGDENDIAFPLRGLHLPIFVYEIRVAKVGSDRTVYVVW